LGDVVFDKHHSTKDLEPFSRILKSRTFEIQDNIYVDCVVIKDVSNLDIQ